MTTNFSQLQKAGYGLMNFTWVASRKFTPEQFSATLKEVLNASGASEAHPLLLNGGEFYGVPDRYENLSLLGSFFKSNPEYADKVYLSIKGGTNAMWGPDTSRENLVKTIDVIDQHLQPLYQARSKHPKTLDMFTLARIGEEPIEQVMEVLLEKKKEGKFTSLCFSEISAETLKRAQAVGKVDALELEFSLFHREPVTNGLFEISVASGIPVVCYSPLGKGLLVGQKTSDLAKDDMRHNFDKFSDPEVIKNNQVLVDKVQAIAKENNLTPAQVALSWITTLSGSKHNGVTYPHLLPIPGSTNPSRQQNNLDVVSLSPKIMSEIDSVLDSFKTAGGRYNKMIDQFTYK